MRRVELHLEHIYKNKFIKRYKFGGRRAMAVLGKTLEADIRLLGEDVSDVHAILEFENGKWFVADMGSQHGTWIQKKPVVRYEVTDETQVNIGGHQLRLVPRTLETPLFVKDEKSEIKKGTVYHQVIVKKRGHVESTHLLKADEGFTFNGSSGESKIFKAPAKHDWTTTEFSDFVVQQRLVRSEILKQTQAERIRNGWDRTLNLPLAAAFVFLFLVLGVVILAPQKPTDEANLKPDLNQYTRMIYDAKTIKKERLKATKLLKNMAGKNTPAPTAQPEKAQTTAQTKGSGAQVVNRIKAAGLAQLIGKISQRAAKTANFIQVNAGRTPDQGASAPALSASTIGTQAGKSGTGGTFKIDGVKTAGLGGGGAVGRGVGSLGVGNVGNATVGVIEEETEIDGGLDREVISRVIQSQLGQIRYCYERQLSASPDLYGKVMVKFTIGAEGEVTTQAVGLSTLKSAMVEGCILRRIAGWKFPKPKGGTSVLVSYPFLFKSTN